MIPSYNGKSTTPIGKKQQQYDRPHFSSKLTIANKFNSKF